MNDENTQNITDSDAVKKIIVQNLAEYRKSAGLTQQELAEKLNYSDKSVSKWERGEGLPDILVLKALADIYGVSVNDFFVEHKNEKIRFRSLKTLRAKRWLIALLSTGLVWLIATIVTVTWLLIDSSVPVAKYAYLVAFPVSMVVLLVFSCLWCKLWEKCLVASILVWSLCILVDVVLVIDNSWLIYMVGVVLQLLVVMWYLLRYFVLKDKWWKEKVGFTERRSKKDSDLTDNEK